MYMYLYTYTHRYTHPNILYLYGERERKSKRDDLEEKGNIPNVNRNTIEKEYSEVWRLFSLFLHMTLYCQIFLSMHSLTLSFSKEFLAY